MTTSDHFLSARDALSKGWPSFLPELPEESLLDRVWVQPLEVISDVDGIEFATQLLVDGELELKIPGLDSVSLLFAAMDGGTLIPAEVHVRPDFLIRIANLPLSLRFDAELLKPVRKAPAAEPDQATSWEVDPTRKYVEIQLAQVTLEIDGDGEISLSTELEIDLPPAMIAETGVVIEARRIGIFLDSSEPPEGQPIGWRGIHIARGALYLPGELAEIVGHQEITDAYIGNGGFSGTVSNLWTPELEADLFGMGFTLARVQLEFVQNALVSSKIAGTATLPFFDEKVPVELAINLNGALTVKLGGSEGLHEFVKPGLLKFKLDSLGFEITGNLLTAKMSGTLTPLVGDLDWPGLGIRELAIDSRGNVHLDGGWLNLREQGVLDFHGFKLEVTKVGFGTEDDGSRWLGFTGGLKLVDGMKAGASVEGLRIRWKPSGTPSLSFEGIGVELEIPGAVRFKGAVSYRKLSEAGQDIHRFDGAIKLELLALGMEIDSNLVVGRATGEAGPYDFMAIHLGVELPAGIPLFSTGLALYGMAGLYAMNMEPDKKPDEPWYGLAEGEGWYKRPTVGVTDLQQKWAPRDGSTAFGAGVTIGTLSDNGYAFNSQMILVLVFPGPIILLEGKANLLEERTSMGEDPLFRALAVLDNRAGSMQFGLDARYKVDESGKLIDIGGSAEAFFSYSDPQAWRLSLGQREPRENRIRARFLSAFDANCYFTLDSSSLATGAWAGLDKRWTFGPLKVVLEAWIEGNAKLSWKATQFQGDLWAHGSAELRVYGIGAGLSIDARISGAVFDPYHIIGDFSVGIKTPWPLPNFSVTITLEWGPEISWPELPLPLQEVAVEHFKVSTAWPLPRSQGLIAPNFDKGGGFRVEMEPPSAESLPAPSAAPVVPLDARPHLMFSRAVHDDAKVGTNASVVNPERERIGDPEENTGPATVRYSLLEVSLDEWDADENGWKVVARRAAPSLPANADGVDSLYGSWAAVPPMPDGGGSGAGQTKLWLWSKNPYDFTRRSGREWVDAFGDRFDDYPCVEIPESSELCWSFEPVALGPLSTTTIGNVQSWTHVEEPELALSWLGPEGPPIFNHPGDAGTLVKALCLPQHVHAHGPYGTRNFLELRFPVEPNRGVRVYCRDPEGVFGWAVDDKGQVHTAQGGMPESPWIEFQAEGVTQVVLQWNSRFCFWRYCLLQGASPAEVEAAEDALAHAIESLEYWQEIEPVFRPHTTYRIAIRTHIDAQGESPLSGNQMYTQLEYAYFKTEGPPVLGNYSVPTGESEPERLALMDAEGDFVRLDGSPAAPGSPILDTELNDLGIYVQQTLPPTVPPPGQHAELPRPVYRAFEVGIRFNEPYVRSMYRMDSRDLSLYLFDSNEELARDAQGRLLVSNSLWSLAAEPTLDEVEKQWVTTVIESSCGEIDVSEIPRDEVLSTAGFLLSPDFVYEARLTPLLFRDDFSAEEYVPEEIASGSGARLGRWLVADQGTLQAPSKWKVVELEDPPVRAIEQSANIHDLPTDSSTRRPGTTLLVAPRSDLPAQHADQPSEWTDCRLRLVLRSADDDAVGVVFRRSSDQSWYRFSMDRERRYRRLVRSLDGELKVLAEDDFVYRKNEDYEVVIETVGDMIAVHQNGELVFSVQDGKLGRGGIGLYSWGNVGARFSDVRVDDLRENARSAYRFRFTSSLYSNFSHHVHSGTDSAWSAPADAVLLQTAAAASVPFETPHGDDEARAWEAFENAAGSLLASPAARTEVSQLVSEGAVRALLLRSPEPLDWGRISPSLGRAESRALAMQEAERWKITGVRREGDGAESVGLVSRSTGSPNGVRIERLCFSPVVRREEAEACLLEEDFSGESGVLFSSILATASIEHYEIVDSTDGVVQSEWSMDAATMVQSSNIFGGLFSDTNLSKQGTMALFGSPDWTNVRIRCRVTSTDNDSLGLVFRYVDGSNYYRFEMNRQFGYRRLVQVLDGSFEEIWSDSFVYEVGRPYDVELLAVGSKFYGFVDRIPLFALDREAHNRGRCGLYSWANRGARFSDILVDSLDKDPVLTAGSFPSLDDSIAVDVTGAADGPSSWRFEGDDLVESSGIDSQSSGPIERLGSFLAFPGERADVRVCVGIRPAVAGAMGLMFRLLDESNYYRFSVDSTAGYRRLVRFSDGLPITLWQDNAAPPAGEWSDLVILAVGSRIELWLNGEALVSLNDSGHSYGRTAAYVAGSSGARFARFKEFDETRTVGRFAIVDLGTTAGPSLWLQRFGMLTQLSDIQGGSSEAASPDKPGTLAITGSPVWRDYRLSVAMRSDDDDAIGLVFRYQDAEHYYLLSFDAQRGYRRLSKRSGQANTVLWEGAGGYTVGDLMRVTVDAVGSQLKGFLDGEELFVVEDNEHETGKVGLYSWACVGARFEYMEVCAPPVDAFALLRSDFDGDDLSSWLLVDKGSASGPMAWSMSAGELRQTGNTFAPPLDPGHPDKEGTYAVQGAADWEDVVIEVDLSSGDDDAIGVMFRYTDDDNYYRFSMDLERSYWRLVSKRDGVFRVLWEDDGQYELERWYRLRIVAVGESIQIHVDGILAISIVDSDHEQGQIALYCYANFMVRFRRLRVFPQDMAFGAFALLETFPVPRPFRWTPFDETPEGGPSDWRLEQGDLVQTSEIGAPDSTKFGGLYVAGRENWRDQRISVVLRADGSGSFGLVFRRSAVDRYYRFSIDAQTGNRELARRDGDSTVVLWSGTGSFGAEHSHVLSVECFGSRISCRLDGKLAVTLLDPEGPDFGVLALYCHQCPTAVFERVQVETPEWTPYYRFHREPDFGSGTRLRVYSGRELESDALDPREERRFATPSIDSPDLRLHEADVALRVLEESGSGHARRFLSSADYSSLPFRWLRRRDGTAALLLPEAAPGFEPGEYRLGLSYRLDNSAQDADATLLAESGSSEPDVTDLDFRVDEVAEE